MPSLLATMVAVTPRFNGVVVAVVIIAALSRNWRHNILSVNELYENRLYKFSRFVANASSWRAAVFAGTVRTSMSRARQAMHLFTDSITALKEEALVGRDTVHAVARHEKLGFTESQRGDAINYEAGQVVEFHRRARGGFKSGERWQVAGRDCKAVLIVKDGHTKLALFTSVNSFDAYELQEISLAVGDVVRVTKNFAVGAHGFKNNELCTVGR